MESVDETHPPKSDGRKLQEEANPRYQMNMDRTADGDLSDEARLKRLTINTYFSSGDVLHPRQFKVLLLIHNYSSVHQWFHTQIDDKLRDYLITAVNDLQKKKEVDMNVDFLREASLLAFY